MEVEHSKSHTVPCESVTSNTSVERTSQGLRLCAATHAKRWALAKVMTAYRYRSDYILEGNLPAIKRAIDKGIKVNEKDKYGFTLVHRACANHKPTILSLLIQRGSKLDETATDGWMPLHLAAVSGALGCPCILVRAGARPDMQD